MIIDLTKEEWEFLERMCTKAVALTEMADGRFNLLKDSDYQKAKKLLDKFIIGRQ